MKYCDLVGQLQVGINYLYLKLSYNTTSIASDHYQVSRRLSCFKLSANSLKESLFIENLNCITIGLAAFSDSLCMTM